MIAAGVIQIDKPGSKAALVYGQMNEPPGARARVALSGLTLAEYFRDKEGQDVLFFVDNIFLGTKTFPMIEDLMKLTFEAGHLMKCLTFKSIQTQIKMPTGTVIYYCICKTGYMDCIRIW